MAAAGDVSDSDEVYAGDFEGDFLEGDFSGIVLQNLWPMGVIGFFNLVGAGLFFRRRLA